MTLINQIAQHLHNQGIGSLASSLFYSYLPDDDSLDFNITVLDTGGETPDIYLPTTAPTFQVFIRAKDYTTGKAKVDAIRTALHQQKNTELITGETYFYYIFLKAEGGHLGRNEAGRDEFSMNFYTKTR